MSCLIQFPIEQWIYTFNQNSIAGTIIAQSIANMTLLIYLLFIKPQKNKMKLINKEEIRNFLNEVKSKCLHGIIYTLNYSFTSLTFYYAHA